MYHLHLIERQVPAHTDSSWSSGEGQWLTKRLAADPHRGHMFFFVFARVYFSSFCVLCFLCVLRCLSCAFLFFSFVILLLFSFFVYFAICFSSWSSGEGQRLTTRLAADPHKGNMFVHCVVLPLFFLCFSLQHYLVVLCCLELCSFVCSSCLGGGRRPTPKTNDGYV